MLKIHKEYKKRYFDLNNSCLPLQVTFLKSVRISVNLRSKGGISCDKFVPVYYIFNDFIGDI